MHWVCDSYNVPWRKIFPGDTVSSDGLVAYPVGELILRGEDDPKLRLLRLKSAPLLVVAIVPGYLQKGGGFGQLFNDSVATFFFLSRHGLICTYGDRC